MDVICVASTKFTPLFYSLQIKNEKIIVIDKLNKQLETDELARIISYILFLCLILAIKMSSTIIKIAISILAKSTILLSSFPTIIYRCLLCLILNSNMVYLIKYLFSFHLLILSNNSSKTSILVVSLVTV